MCVLMEMEMEVVGNGAKKKEGTVCVCLDSNRGT